VNKKFLIICFDKLEIKKKSPNRQIENDLRIFFKKQVFPSQTISLRHKKIKRGTKTYISFA